MVEDENKRNKMEQEQYEANYAQQQNQYSSMTNQMAQMQNNFGNFNPSSYFSNYNL